VLLLERCYHCHHCFDKARPVGTLGPKAAFTPQDTRTDRALCRIVGWVHAFHADERPQSVVHFAYLAADACGLRHSTRLPGLEQPGDFPSDWAHQDAETRVSQRPITDAVPPVKHLADLLPQGFANGLGAPSALDHGFNIPQQMCPADLPPPRRIPTIGTPAIGDQDAAESLAQDFLYHLASTRQAHDKDRHPCGHSHPQPRACPAFTPACFIQMCDGLSLHVGLRFRDGRGQRMCGRLLQVGNGPETHGQTKQGCHHLLGRTLRQMIRARAQGNGRLHARTERPWRHPSRNVCTGDCATARARQSMQLILGHDGLGGRQFGHLMPVRLRIDPGQRLPAVGTLRGKDGNEDVHLCEEHKRARLSCMAGLPTRLPATGPTTWPLGLGWRRITRWRS